jgi:NADPH-dependent 2,4-dienoyl-CoA reductase/sulfur reductase-like enzyme
VLTPGAAQILLKSQGILPARRALVAGSGPFLLVVATDLAAAGVEVVGVVEAASGAWLDFWPLLAHPRMLGEGLGHLRALRRFGVPVYWRHAVRVIHGHEQVDRVVVGRLDPQDRFIAGSDRQWEVDAVCLGFGFIPSVELLRLAGCELTFDHHLGGWIPRRSPNGETSVSGIFAIGDGAGVGGAAIARLEGCLAGLRAAERLGYRVPLDARHRVRGWLRELRRLRAARTILSRAYAFRPGLLDLATPDTIVCRCEEVTTAEILAAIREGAQHVGQVKAWTRVGMGLCQGRICGPSVAALVARETGQSGEAVGYFNPRPPVKPLSAEAFAGSAVGDGT